MTMKRFIQAAGIVAVALLMVASASASSISYTTNSGLTLFLNANGAITNGGLTLADTLGVPATITFTPNSASSSGTPSNINLGDFLLTCATCSLQATNGGVGGSYFGAFQFDLVVTDTTDNAVGKFVGTSTGGSVWYDVSQINIVWSPLYLGPGKTPTPGYLSGDFGQTVFTITSPTGIVAPNSGTPNGDSTVQGHVATSGIPEPATFLLLGAGLLGLGALRRKRA